MTIDAVATTLPPIIYYHGDMTSHGMCWGCCLPYSQFTPQQDFDWLKQECAWIGLFHVMTHEGVNVSRSQWRLLRRGWLIILVRMECNGMANVEGVNVSWSPLFWLLCSCAVLCSAMSWSVLPCIPWVRVEKQTTLPQLPVKWGSRGGVTSEREREREREMNTETETQRETKGKNKERVCDRESFFQNNKMTVC